MWVTNQQAALDFEYESWLAMAREPLVFEDGYWDALATYSRSSRRRGACPYRVDVPGRRVGCAGARRLGAARRKVAPVYLVVRCSSRRANLTAP